MNFNKETIKKNVTGYLNNLDNDRREGHYGYGDSVSHFIYHGLSILMGLIVVLMLLIPNILEKDMVIEMYGGLSYILFFLAFIYILCRLFDAIWIKRHQWDLGLMKDFLRVLFYSFTIFIISAFTLISIATYAEQNPEVEEKTNLWIKAMTNMLYLITFLSRVVAISIVLRCFILFYLLFKDTNSGKRTRIKKNVSIKLSRGK